MLRFLLLWIFFYVISDCVKGQDELSLRLSDYRTATTDTAKARALGSLSNYYTSTIPDSAIYYARKGLELVRGGSHPRLEMELIFQLGVIANVHSSFDIARKNLMEAKKMAEQIGYKKGIASSSNIMGVMEAKNGNLDLATAYFISALKLFKELNDSAGVSDAYIKLGIINELSGDYEKALEYYFTVKEREARNPISVLSIGLYNNIGTIYAKKKEYEKALKYFEEGIQQSDSIRFGAIHITLLTNIGNVYSRMKRREEGILYHRLALEKAIRFKLPEEQARAYINLASDFTESDYSRSISYLNSAIATLNKSGSAHHLLRADIYKALVETHQYYGNYKEAFLNLESYHRISDSIYSLQKERQIAALQAEYELEESKGHIQNLKLANQKTIFQRNLGIAIGGAITVILLIFWVSLRNVRRLNKQLRESNQVKDKLFSIIGHDLRGPVGGMIQMLQTLDAKALPPEEQEATIHQLMKQGEATYEVLNNLLNWGAMQLNTLEVKKTAFYPRQVLLQSMDMLSHQIAGKQLHIRESVPEDIQLYGSQEHFDFVVRNLLSNAIKFTPDEGEITIRAERSLRENGVVFSVRDTGRGMDEEQCRRFSDDLRIGTSYGTNGEKGTGLGLMLCREFIRANGGRIWVESRKGEGTVFCFTFPEKTT